jgi:hypothetical protein
LKGLTPGKVQSFATQTLALDGYFRRPGDGRKRPAIPARALVWAFLLGVILREHAFYAVERLVRSSARRALCVTRRFGHDALAYFTERQDPAATRRALYAALRRAKRQKAFASTRWIGIVLDGTGACRVTKEPCDACHPTTNADDEITSYHHHFSLAAVVGGGLVLPVDAEPYGPGDSEYAASQRLLRRCVAGLGQRFAAYVAADGEYATAPFLHAVGETGLRVVARLKGNVPNLFHAAERRFCRRPPTAVFQVDRDRVEVWDAENFDPWDGLNWPTVRVLRYRQHKPDGSVVEAYWLTDWPTGQVGSRALYLMAKSRWNIENGGFNDGKNRYGMEHTHHHHERSLLNCWLLIALAMTIERLYRQRHLHRGSHPVRSPKDLCFLLWLSLGRPTIAADTS